PDEPDVPADRLQHAHPHFVEVLRMKSVALSLAPLRKLDEAFPCRFALLRLFLARIEGDGRVCHLEAPEGRRRNGHEHVATPPQKPLYPMFRRRSSAKRGLSFASVGFACAKLSERRIHNKTPIWEKSRVGQCAADAILRLV